MLLAEEGKIPPLTVEKENQTVVHLSYLDGLRALAAMYVVVHHAGRQVTDVFKNKVALKMYFVAWFGHNAVDVFIVLSGFCLMLPVVRNNGVLKGSAKEFYIKRAKRILPTYYIAAAFSMLLIVTLIDNNTNSYWHSTSPVTGWDLFTHFTLIQDIFPNSVAKINYAFWSISVEWRIYFLFPLLVWCAAKWGSLRTTFTTIVLSVGLAALLTNSNLNINLDKNGINPHYIGLFSLGMLAAQISYSNKDIFVRLRNFKYWKTAFFCARCFILRSLFYKRKMDIY